MMLYIAKEIKQIDGIITWCFVLIFNTFPKAITIIPTTTETDNRQHVGVASSNVRRRTMQSVEVDVNKYIIHKYIYIYTGTLQA